MNLHIQFRKLDPTPALKRHVEDMVKKLDKHVTYPMEVHVVLSVNKVDHMAEITCYAEHHELVALAKSKNLYESIETAVKKLEQQLKKHRERKKGHTAAHFIARPKGLKMARDVGAELPHQVKNKG